ncbi:CD177 antigen-like [Dromiciops gliroides]|uniref:CD177 antigen-like n=1 Tax=Dromiciops gliroides TaxID=33562 RepID=UPI001CC38009|nr:CD177 antigen-like [Dromiciops gliroides]
MAGRLCLQAVLCHLWLCLSRTAELRCHLMPLTQLGPGPSPSPSPGPASDVLKCEELEVCYHTLLRVRTGPVVTAFRSKGCTLPGLQTSGMSWYRQPPEVSIALYNHMCSEDLCNDDQSAASLWNVADNPRRLNRSALAPGDLRCPACAAVGSCPEDPPLTPCPEETRCYRGVLELLTGNSSLPLAVWGCGSWADCSLLDGFWTPGPIAMRETCDKSDAQDLSGRWTVRDGSLVCCCVKSWEQEQRRRAVRQFKAEDQQKEKFEEMERKPIAWGSIVIGMNDLARLGWRRLEAEPQMPPGSNALEMAVVSALRLRMELQGIIIATKGCFRDSVQEPTVVKYTQPPGVAATSYTHFCSTDFCNNYTDPRPLTEPPKGAVSPHQEGLMCPTCISLGPCIPGSPVMHCPKHTLSCYSGTIMIKGGGIWTPVDVEGCMGEINCRLLNRTHTIGPLELRELCDRSSLFDNFRMDRGSCILPAPVWALGLGSLLIL